MARAATKVDPEAEAARLLADRRALRVATGFDISKLLPHPENPNNGDVEAIVESLKAFDQYRPIVVQRSTMFIVAGNHTYFGALELGWKKMLVNFIECDDDVALQIMLADNNIARKARVDDGQLAKILTHLSERGKIQATSYTTEDLSGLLYRLNATAPTDFADLNPDRDFEHKCPRCGFEYGDRATK